MNEKLNEVKAFLETDQRKTELEKKAYIEILENYKSTWQQYQVINKHYKLIILISNVKYLFIRLSMKKCQVQLEEKKLK